MLSDLSGLTAFLINRSSRRGKRGGDGEGGSIYFICEASGGLEESALLKPAHTHTHVSL